MTRAGYDAESLGRIDPQWRSWLDLRHRVGSTNDAAAELARAGCSHGTTDAAHRQSTGRGRRGAPWVCPPGGGLAFSVVLKPGSGTPVWSRAAMVAGLTVACELERLGLDARVKWPNDVLVGGRKICGVLVEATPEFAVVGIGVNVNVVEFPTDLKSIATSVQIELARPAAREPLLVGIRNGLLHWFEKTTTRFPEVLETLGKRCALRGKPITARTSAGTLSGIVRGFGPAGELLIESNGTVQRLVQADEIRVSNLNSEV
jgi:BirA family biotin operon repressor/biotin-[acetyl-CoA-carboxylase] ligase